MARIYLASSWRNPYQPQVLSALRGVGHAVYDFREDQRVQTRSGHELGVEEPSATAFAWSEMDPRWQDWSPSAYRRKLQTSQRAAQGFIGDLRGMEWADTCVLCLPCGNSAHIEAGHMKGRGKRLIIYWNTDAVRTEVRGPEGALVKAWNFEPDLMYLLADNLVIGVTELLQALSHGQHDPEAVEAALHHAATRDAQT